jgi:hypothetical protein
MIQRTNDNERRMATVLEAVQQKSDADSLNSDSGTVSRSIPNAQFDQSRRDPVVAAYSGCVPIVIFAGNLGNTPGIGHYVLQSGYRN